MATFVSKTWVDAIFSYPTRYKLIHQDLTQEQVTLVNDFEDAGQTPIQTGDVFDAATFNNLENRVAAGFSSCVETLSGTSAPTASEGKDGDTYIQTEVTGGTTSVVAMFVKINGAWLEISVGGASLPQAEGGGF